ncbi:unnamed protein product [Albugo candida]|uniref:RxLR effector protein n=1 Tax=Albugo candida TaxID=65357 RepID=A0A024FXB9_9STRA|nr:unnamed protein product [Albugo candida]|eukprot:CCI11309.1 unnamed protein product [Albugo candida]
MSKKLALIASVLLCSAGQHQVTGKQSVPDNESPPDVPARSSETNPNQVQVDDKTKQGLSKETVGTNPLKRTKKITKLELKELSCVSSAVSDTPCSSQPPQSKSKTLLR